MTAQHTPGPWVAVARTNAHIEIEAPNQLGYLAQKVASCSLTNHEANARLIAAAPELLDALQVMLRDYAAVHDVGDVEMQPAIYQARAAIQKATNMDAAIGAHKEGD